MGSIDPVRRPSGSTASASSVPVPWVAGSLIIGFVMGGIAFHQKAPAPAPVLAHSIIETAVVVPVAATPMAVVSNAPPLPRLERPEPAAVAAPVEPPRRPFSPLSFYGNGPQATGLFQLEPGLYVASLSHNGTSNFIVHLVDEYGRKVDNSLANVIGQQTLSKAFRISKSGRYLLSIDADGDWTAAINEPGKV